MTEYKLEIKQIVDYPKCRVYRQFIQSLITDRNIRTNGCSGLFHYVVLCCYANFRTSYQRYDGTPGRTNERPAFPERRAPPAPGARRSAPPASWISGRSKGILPLPKLTNKESVGVVAMWPQGNHPLRGGSYWVRQYKGLLLEGAVPC